MSNLVMCDGLSRLDSRHDTGFSSLLSSPFLSHFVLQYFGTGSLCATQCLYTCSPLSWECAPHALHPLTSPHHPLDQLPGALSADGPWHPDQRWALLPPALGTECPVFAPE